MWNSMLPITSGMVSFIGILQENRHKVKLHVFFFRVQHASKQTHVLYFSMFQILILISFHCAAILYFSYSWVLKNLPSKKVLTIERDDIERPRSSARRTSANLFIYANQHAPEFTFFFPRKPSILDWRWLTSNPINGKGIYASPQRHMPSRRSDDHHYRSEGGTRWPQAKMAQHMSTRAVFTSVKWW